MTIINKESRIPLYCQLTDELIRQIQSGVLQSTERLPSERELCEQYDLSRTTVRQSLNELKREGYIQVLHGKGSFVSPLSIMHDIQSFYSFTNEIKNLGKIPSSKILHFECISTTEELRMKMGLINCRNVFKITRLRLADNVPLMHEITYIPEERFIGLTLKDLENRSLYNVMEDNFHIHITGGSESLKAMPMPKNIADYLNIKKGTPSIYIERLTYEFGSVIEYTETITRGDQFVFRVKMKK